MSIHTATGITLEDRALILIENYAHIDTINGGTAGKDGWPQMEVTNDHTYGGWQPLTAGLSGAYIHYDFGGPATVDTIGIAAHTLGSTNCQVIFFLGDDGFFWDEVIRFSPADDSPIVGIFAEQSRRHASILIEYAAPDPDPGPIIGVVKIGKSIIMPRGIYGGHSPTVLSRTTATRPLMSETGQFVGRVAIRHGFRGDYSWSNLDPSWYRSTFDPFVGLARSSAFFLAWRPYSYQDEVVFCQTVGDIAPTNSGRANLMDVSMPIEAHDWEAAT